MYACGSKPSTSKATDSQKTFSVQDEIYATSEY